jgi:hypothetical protein
MSREFKTYFFVIFRIISFFVIAILFTFLTDSIRPFFGDTVKPEGYKTTFNSIIDDGHIWHIRHYLYFWMCFSLFVSSAIFTIVSIADEVNKNR